MNIKVNFEKLENVKNVSDRNKESLYYEIKKLLASLERLKNIWVGEDFDRYYDNAYNYIKRMNVLCSFMDTIDNAMKNASTFYKRQDEGCANSLKEEEAGLNGQNRN